MRPNPDRAFNPFKSDKGLDWIPSKAYPAHRQTSENRGSPAAEASSAFFLNLQGSSPGETLPWLPAFIRGQESDKPQSSQSPTLYTTHKDISRKAAPPVPKKPTNLAKSIETLEVARTAIPPNGLHRAQTQSSLSTPSQGQYAGLWGIQSSYHARSSQGTQRQVTGDDDIGKEAGADSISASHSNLDRPTLPPRPQIDLMDKDEDDAKNIPSLKPLRH